MAAAALIGGRGTGSKAIDAGGEELEELFAASRWLDAHPTDSEVRQVTAVPEPMQSRGLARSPLLC